MQGLMDPLSAYGWERGTETGTQTMLCVVHKQQDACVYLKHKIAPTVSKMEISESY